MTVHLDAPSKAQAGRRHHDPLGPGRLLERIRVASTTDTIRAARLIEHGKPVSVEAVVLAPPADGEVRIDLAYGGVNPIDRYIAEGRVAPDAKLPRTPGGEASGIVDGRPVLVAGAGLGTARDGVWAQIANVPADAVVPLPDGVELQPAAAMGIAGLTALKCVREVGRVDKDDRVLVLGASGGVGSMIVSLARVRRGDGVGSDRVSRTRPG